MYDDILATITSVLRSSDNAASRRVLLGAAAHYLEEKASTERLNRNVLAIGLGLFAAAIGGLFVTLARL